MNHLETGSPEPEQTREEKLQTAIDVASEFLQNDLDHFKKEVSKNEAAIRKDLDSVANLFIDSNRRTRSIVWARLEKAKKGDFFSGVNDPDDESLYAFFKREVEKLPGDIEKELQGRDQNDPDNQELVEDLQRDLVKMEEIVRTIEATDEFKEFFKK